MIEIERRFLLKRVPTEVPVTSAEKIVIDQFYVPDGPRLRSSYKKDGDVEYVKCYKKRISEMSNEEHEERLTREEFRSLLVSATKIVRKNRMKVAVGQLIWEIDEFLDPTRIVIAEVEIPSEDTEVEIPDFIKSELIMEITGIQQFSNFNLARNY